MCVRAVIGYQAGMKECGSGYSQAGMVDNAHNVFDEMLERKRSDFWEKSLCGVVPVLVGNGVFGERLDKVLEFVEKTGVRRLGDAEELVRKMESCEIVVKPDIHSYNDLLVEYFKIYKHMIEEGEFDGALRLCKYIIMIMIESKKIC
jgi:pentatricopeptide repeat protein